MMKLRLVAACVIPLLAGCQPPSAPSGAADRSHAKSTQTVGKNPAVGGGDSQTITPLGPNIGPMTPVGGGENLDKGPSGGLTNAAKDRARSLASDSSKTTTDTDSNDP